MISTYSPSGRPGGRLIEEASGAGVVVKQAVVGGRPDPVNPLGHIGNQHVGVELGIPRPRSPVGEPSRNESLGPQHVQPTGPRRTPRAWRSR